MSYLKWAPLLLLCFGMGSSGASVSGKEAGLTFGDATTIKAHLHGRTHRTSTGDAGGRVIYEVGAAAPALELVETSTSKATGKALAKTAAQILALTVIAGISILYSVISSIVIYQMEKTTKRIEGEVAQTHHNVLTKYGNQISDMFKQLKAVSTAAAENMTNVNEYDHVLRSQLDGGTPQTSHSRNAFLVERATKNVKTLAEKIPDIVDMATVGVRVATARAAPTIVMSIAFLIMGITFDVLTAQAILGYRQVRKVDRILGESWGCSHPFIHPSIHPSINMYGVSVCVFFFPAFLWVSALHPHTPLPLTYPLLPVGLLMAECSRFRCNKRRRKHGVSCSVDRV